MLESGRKHLQTAGSFPVRFRIVLNLFLPSKSTLVDEKSLSLESRILPLTLRVSKMFVNLYIRLKNKNIHYVSNNI